VGRACSTHGKKMITCKVLVEDPVGNRQLGRPRYRRNIKRMGCSGLDGSASGCGHVEGSCEHGDELSGFVQCCEVLEWVSDYQLLKKGWLA
jgi:hypothetical protein